MSLRRMAALPTLLLAAACGGSPLGDGIAVAGTGQTTAGVPFPEPKPAEVPGQVAPQTAQSFTAWLDGVKAEARARGISDATLARAFAGVTLNQEVLRLDGQQAEFTRPVWEYLENAVSDSRIRNGRARRDANAATLTAAVQAYGVQPEIMVAIWGLESGYGSNTGGFSVIESLATLAYGSRRAADFREYLLQALQILERGDIAADQMKGSWAGAMGQPQFMPTAYLTYAVDQDRDGHRDIWNSEADTLASIGNYLARHGWQAGQRWGREISLPSGFDYAQAELTVERTLSDWQALGVTPVGGGALDVREAASGSIITPAGARGPAFLIYPNFRVILRYNNSTSYALAVAHLADRIAGGGPIAGAWPRDDRPLSLSQRQELQRLLAARGYDPGGVDGMVGPMTRGALRQFQREIGLPADGYPTTALLDRLRALS